MVLSLNNEEFGVIHSGNKFWKIKKIEFVGIFTYICRFSITFNVQDEANTSNHINEDIIRNI